MATEEIDLKALRAKLNEIEKDMPPKGVLPSQEVEDHLELIPPGRLLQLIALAMIDGRARLHHFVRTMSRHRWVTRHASIGSNFAAKTLLEKFVECIDVEIMSRSKTSREVRDLVHEFCWHDSCEPQSLWSSDEPARIAEGIVAAVLGSIEEDILFDLIVEAALFDCFTSDCDADLCEGALAILLRREGESNHERVEQMARMHRLMAFLPESEPVPDELLEIG